MTFTQLFPGKDPKEIAESIKHKEISINMSYNKSLKKLVCQMLLKNPENRVSIIQIMSHKEIVEYENSKFPFSRSSEINFSYLM
jgi:serine/threonine protein kinase